MNQIKITLFDWAGKIAIGLVAYGIVLGVFLLFWHRFHQMIARKDAFAQQPVRLTQAYLRSKQRAAQNGHGNGTVPTYADHLQPNQTPLSRPSA